ncbi:MAG: radical SAM protein [Lachnospiraceae bacterium]|nr:radical SAM protein [Lachnospiraceae bacterium]
MKISKKDAYSWFRFYADLPEDEELMTSHYDIIYSVLAQIEDAVDDRISRLRGEIPGLKTLDGRSFYVGPEEKFPKGCMSCLMGNGLTAIRKTNKCNIRCRFCYNFGEMEDIMPIGEGVWDIGGSRYYERDLDLLFHIHGKPSGVAYVYLEPFMEIEKYYGIIRRFHEAGVYQHMYTNGTLATEENLKALAEAGLDELRFNLGATNCSDKVIENIRLAKKYIPAVGIETPMTPEYFETFQVKKEQILTTGVDFMNCAELHLNENNLDNYFGENMYMCHHGYLSPIWSHELTCRFMKMAGEEGWNVAVHDCCNMTKFARGLNQTVKEGKWFGANNFECEFPEIPFEAFLPVLEDDSFRFLEEEPMEYIY